MTKKQKYLYVIFAIAMLYACARPAAPGGGPLDTIPPRLVEEASTPNFSTRFTDREIILEFDEFIEVKSTSKEVIISPPMINRPIITSRGKKLTLKFNELEPLREDATYTINFGKSISDYRAGNKVENFRFIFSTGDYIDSLSIRGKVIDVLTQEAAKDVLVMLYDNLDDSIIYKERPFYFTSVEKDGSFRLDNLKSDTFQIFGLKDLNANYYFDQVSESLAFIDSSFILTDSSSFNFNMSISDPKLPVVVKEKLDKVKGELFFIMNQDASMANFSFIDEVPHQTVIIKDSLKIWYQTQDSLLRYVIENDTSTINIKKTKPSKQKRKIGLLEASNNRLAIGLAPSKSATVQFTLPLSSINKDSIEIRDTSDVKLNWELIEIDSTDSSTLNLKGKWSSNKEYNITIYPGALIDYFEGTNRDTIRSKVFVTEKSKFGTIVLNYTGLDSSTYYVTTIQDKLKNKTIRSFRGDTSQVIRYPLMAPGEYNLEVLLDRNNNGVWDGSDYNTRSKAEKIIKQELDILRPDWELTVDVKL